MKQLRNAIMRSFVLYFLGLSITGGLIEEFFNQLEELFLGNRYQISVQLVSGLFQIFAVIGFSFLFYHKMQVLFEIFFCLHLFVKFCHLFVFCRQSDLLYHNISILSLIHI